MTWATAWVSTFLSLSGPQYVDIIHYASTCLYLKKTHEYGSPNEESGRNHLVILDNRGCQKHPLQSLINSDMVLIIREEVNAAYRAQNIVSKPRRCSGYLQGE